MIGPFSLYKNEYCLTQAAIAQRYIQMIGTPSDHTQVLNEHLCQIPSEKAVSNALQIIDCQSQGLWIGFGWRQFHGKFEYLLTGTFCVSIIYIQPLQAKYGKP